MDLRAHGEHFLPSIQLILNQIRFFIKCLRRKPSGYESTKQLSHFVTQNCKMCMFPFWQATPEWKTRTISQQTQWQSELLCALPTFCILHWAMLVLCNKETKCKWNRIVVALHFILPKGYWQSGGSALWRRPSSHHDDRPQHGRRHCSSHGRCQSCTVSAWPMCDWCCRRYECSISSQQTHNRLTHQTQWQMASVSSF